ncbi:hypothetical protein QVD17_35279 [Tagetes erecta]|uniref:Uncharacterized protein n=1 Tax=Tagetes erecta TaxID=13708 RepID=A0AAD8NF20_TARER|nr:hypothetical protein QVD17_35279 [Tagetes erecta]
MYACNVCIMGSKREKKSFKYCQTLAPIAEEIVQIADNIDIVSTYEINYCQTLAQIADDIVIQSSRRHQSLAPINHSSSGQHRKPPKSFARFANGHIHRSVIGILDQKLDRIWPMFSMIPHSKLKEMFNTFWVHDVRLELEREREA